MCGIAMVRLLKPLDYYQEKYGTWQYGLQKMYLLMEKQHNRGQEGAGLATVKLDVPPGEEYIWRERFEGKNAIQEIFAGINNTMKLAGHEVLHVVEKAKALRRVAFGMVTGRAHQRIGHAPAGEQGFRSRKPAVHGAFGGLVGLPRGVFIGVELAGRMT